MKNTKCSSNNELVNSHTLYSSQSIKQNKYLNGIRNRKQQQTKDVEKMRSIRPLYKSKKKNDMEQVSIMKKKFSKKLSFSEPFTERVNFKANNESKNTTNSKDDILATKTHEDNKFNWNQICLHSQKTIQEVEKMKIKIQRVSRQIEEMSLIKLNKNKAIQSEIMEKRSQSINGNSFKSQSKKQSNAKSKFNFKNLMSFKTENSRKYMGISTKQSQNNFEDSFQKIRFADKDYFAIESKFSSDSSNKFSDNQKIQIPLQIKYPETFGKERLNHDVFKKTKNLIQENNLIKQNTTLNDHNFSGFSFLKRYKFKKNDFKIIKSLGKGHFGEVMLVQNAQTCFICGMKIMSKSRIKADNYQNQIARQLSIQFYLSHRNIASLYGFFSDLQNVYLLIEFCPGGHLLELLRKQNRLEQKNINPIIKQICEGVDYVHKQCVIHRDIKPENILFSFDVVKICDFGWAVYNGTGLRKTASGSPLYYSPEIVKGVFYNQTIDNWDIGMLTYECLIGKTPFKIYSQFDLNRIVEDEVSFPSYVDTSQQVRDFILKIMKKEPQLRLEISSMLKHPFLTSFKQQLALPIQEIMNFKELLSQ